MSLAEVRPVAARVDHRRIVDRVHLIERRAEVQTRQRHTRRTIAEEVVLALRPVVAPEVAEQMAPRAHVVVHARELVVVVVFARRIGHVVLRPIRLTRGNVCRRKQIQHLQRHRIERPCIRQDIVLDRLPLDDTIHCHCGERVVKLVRIRAAARALARIGRVRIAVRASQRQQRRKVARPLRRRRHRVVRRRRLRVLQALIRPEEEKLVLAVEDLRQKHRAAHRTAILVVVRHRNRCDRARVLVEVRVRIEVRDLAELIQATMNAVRTRLRNLVQHAANRMAERRIGIEHIDRDLLHRILRRAVGQRTGPRRIRRSVEQYLRGLRRSSADAPGVTRIVIEGMHLRGVARIDHTRRQLRQHDRCASVQRQVRHLRGRNHLLDRRIRLIDQRCIRRDAHRLLGIAKLQRRIDDRMLARLQGQRLANHLAKARLLDRHLILARR